MIVALSLTTFLLPFYFLRFSILGLKTNLFEFALYLTCLIFIFWRLRYPKLRRQPIKIAYIWPYTAFLLTAIIAIGVAQDKVHAIGEFKGWFFTPVLYFLLLINTFTAQTMPRLSFPLFLSLLISSLWAIGQQFHAVPLLAHQIIDPDLVAYLHDSPHRVFGFTESPNYLAMYIVPAFFLSLPLFTLLKQRREKLLWGLLFLLPITALLMSYSRGGLMAFVLGGLILYLRTTYHRSGTLHRAVTIVFSLFSLSLTWRIMHMFIHPNSSRGRKRILLYSLKLLKSHTFFGVGLGGYSAALAKIAANDRDFIVYFLPYAYHPHNLYLALWLNLGLLGLIAFLFLVAIFVKRIRQSRNQLFIRNCLLAGMISILVHGVVDTPYFKNDLSAVFWLMYAWAYLETLPQMEAKQGIN